jgi:hypothetical protein
MHYVLQNGKCRNGKLEQAAPMRATVTSEKGDNATHLGSRSRRPLSPTFEVADAPYDAGGAPGSWHRDEDCPAARAKAA